MNRNEKNTDLLKSPEARRSMILLILGIPVMYIGSFDNPACLILTVVYLLILLINGITCLPLLSEIINNRFKSK